MVCCCCGAAIEANKAAALARRQRHIEEQSRNGGNPGTSNDGRRVNPLDDEEAEAPLEEWQWQLENAQQEAVADDSQQEPPADLRDETEVDGKFFEADEQYRGKRSGMAFKLGYLSLG